MSVNEDLCLVLFLGAEGVHSSCHRGDLRQDRVFLQMPEFWQSAAQRHLPWLVISFNSPLGGLVPCCPWDKTGGKGPQEMSGPSSH